MKKLLNLFLAFAFSFALLTSCGSYDVDLSKDEIQQIKNEISEHKRAISDMEDAGELVIANYINLARSYKKLGKLDKAINVYIDILAEGHVSKAMINNLGQLYEEVGEYDLAIEQYQRLIDIYFDNAYLKNITWAYIYAGDRKNAEKYFNTWQIEFNKTDKQVQDAIKKLREEEKK